MYTTELGTFVEQFKNLWKSGYEAHLDAHTYAGEAWVHLHVRLGQAPVNHPFTSLSRNRNGPARERRRSRRAAERAAKTSNSSNTDLESMLPNAEEASEVIVADDHVTELVKNTCEKNAESEIDATEKVDIAVDEDVHDDANAKDTEKEEIEDTKKDETNVEEVSKPAGAEIGIVTGETLEEPLKGLGNPAEVEVLATVVFEDSRKSKLEQGDLIAVQELIFRERHLKENIKKLEFGQYHTKELRQGFKHSFQISLTVNSGNLWESPRGYIWKFFGKDEWKRKDGSRLTFNRIHSK